MPHLLTRLELNGFKSFAQKTVLEFPAGITAIVGPNGSGKSNIIDAIRWLLGEREARSLRGGKSEDLIFAGTPKRPRLGQAQASLHFENGSKFFSIDFPEITVMRQVARDGANRYFLNKAEIRLKDIVDFFAQARLGTKGFVVITQGNSDLFVRVTPRERREMIEEMLGLREYQLKKIDAERRLEHTSVNLEKVKALTEEILPHLRSLKRQTNRWERREEVERELRELENGFFSARYGELKIRGEELERKLVAAESEREARVGARDHAAAHLKDVESKQPEERKELGVLKEKTEALMRKKSELQKELGRLEAQIEMASRAVPASAGPAAQALHAILKKARAVLGEIAEGNFGEAQAKARELVKEIDGVMRGAPPVSGNVSADIAKKFEALNGELASLEKDIASFREKTGALEKNQEEFYHAFKSAVAAVEAAKDRYEAWENAYKEQRFEKERLSLRREEWENQVRQAGREPGEFTNGDGSGAIPPDASTEQRMFKLRGDLASIGEIDEALLKEARETEARYVFLERELADLEKAQGDLKGLSAELREKIAVEFGKALLTINEEFGKFFTLMFGGGQAKLRIAKRELRSAKEGEEGEEAVAPEEEEEEEVGIEIDLKLPKKRITSLEMLSGGERSLVGIAALFAMISVSPPPFLVLDEIDAPLDERNARRFSEMLKEFSKETQFIIVTHNRATMEAADVLYGITMEDDGTSKVLSLRLENEK